MADTRRVAASTLEEVADLMDDQPGRVSSAFLRGVATELRLKAAGLPSTVDVLGQQQGGEQP